MGVDLFTVSQSVVIRILIIRVSIMDFNLSLIVETIIIRII